MTRRFVLAALSAASPAILTFPSSADPPAAKPAAPPAAAQPTPPPTPTPTAPPDSKTPSAPPATEPAGAAPAKPKALVEFPHPLITEILYAVPTGPEGDANKDGKRDAAGDEFIELINPHDKPINLRGYTITDRNEGKNQFKFTFPPLELPPGGVVVVFNGYVQRWTGPVGDSRTAPEEGNDRFHGARVFTAKAGASGMSWANGGDWALLSDPSGVPVECVWWGKFAETKPEKGLIEEAPLVQRCSVTRLSAVGALVPQTEAGDAAATPGLFPPIPSAAPTAARPADKAKPQGTETDKPGSGKAP